MKKLKFVLLRPDDRHHRHREDGRQQERKNCCEINGNPPCV